MVAAIIASGILGATQYWHCFPWERSICAVVKIWPRRREFASPCATQVATMAALLADAFIPLSSEAGIVALFGRNLPGQVCIAMRRAAGGRTWTSVRRTARHFC